jgi:hypothetical protein
VKRSEEKAESIPVGKDRVKKSVGLLSWMVSEEGGICMSSRPHHLSQPPVLSLLPTPSDWAVLCLELSLAPYCPIKSKSSHTSIYSPLPSSPNIILALSFIFPSKLPLLLLGSMFMQLPSLNAYLP